ncbi:bifunctional P-450/NADPH-P450 reductase [Obba rivulosa]|uniref:Bifunctional P-450/NADPH-P450 reductase n=1 Tax=Obba rivulosa TaxID=1052685 RepID=A0A8E2ALJ4_9APHY|nr:bifunctional P-450/NADPH-P450 reductase [Obba rivulosa]
MTTPIPSPPRIPFLGNVTALDKDLPFQSMNLLAKQYGEVYQLTIVSRKILVVNSQRLVNEVSDERRFRKMIGGGLAEVRRATGDGLFTAHVPGEENWYIAHRLLMPAFSTTAVHGMYDDMMDIVSQLALKWDRFGPQHAIDPAADFTRLTLDAIALSSMSYRLNSFYREEPHPFVYAMGDFLYESMTRANRPGIVQALKRKTQAQYEEDQKIMLSLVDEIIQDRKAHPVDKNDLLNVMLNGVDKETGKKLPDENIKQNLLTFLIAGHETTSGMLTFAVYYLLKNPEAMRKLREEIDATIGDRVASVKDVNKLPYLLAVMRETLRLSPSAPGRGCGAIEDTTLADGKYAVPKGINIVVNVAMAQRDPLVYGDDADEFRPERMLDGKFEALPPNAWQPFGYGMRACIGRAFAWQEVQLTLITLFQKFDLVLHDPSYELRVKQTLTIKPDGLRIHAIPRAGRPRLLAVPSSALLQQGTKSTTDHVQASVFDGAAKQALYVLYGSNTGSSEAFAQRIASGAASHGFRASIGTLDSATAHVPTDGPVAILTASYEGKPTDNAAHFVEWLSALKGREMANVAYSVFGCGNRDWVQTYQRIPKLCDETLAERGAERLAPRGEGDAASGDFFDSFDKWEAQFWEALTERYQTTASGAESVGLDVKTVDAGTGRAELLRQPDATLGTVVDNRLLTASGAAPKRHIEFELPEQTTYRAGDYLAILPVNPARDVHRVLARFGFSAEQEVMVSSSGPTSLPTNKAVSLSTLFSGYVELSQPATKRDLRILSDATTNDGTKKALEEYSNSYSELVFGKRLSMLDILEAHPDIKLSLGAFLSILPSMRIRQYSISSSPLWNPQHATLTISVLETPALSGRIEPFLGVASTFLAGLRPGDKVQLAVRASSSEFHPPSDPSVPLVMFCAGSGLAPMRGFLQERAMQKEAGRDIAKSLLFFGCRSPKDDFLYGDSDLRRWAELGVVDVRPAFSRAPQESEGCKYVQNRVWHDREDVRAAYNAGCKFFVCGASKIAAGVKETLIAIIKEGKPELDDSQAEDIFQEITSGRFATDIFE